MKLAIFIALFVFASLTGLAQTTSSLPDPNSMDCEINGQVVTLQYIHQTLKKNEWLTWAVRLMHKKMDSAFTAMDNTFKEKNDIDSDTNAYHWYMVVYSGGYISLIRETQETYESYDLMAASVSKVNYSDFYLISLTMIRQLLPKDQTVVIGDSEYTLDKISQTISSDQKFIRLDKELAIFKP